MDPNISALAQQLLSNVKESLSGAAKKFVEENASVKVFLEDRAERAAELVVQYGTAAEADRPAIAEAMVVVKQSIVNETNAVLLAAGTSLKDEILAVLKSVFQFALQNLPTILALIPK